MRINGHFREENGDSKTIIVIKVTTINKINRLESEFSGNIATSIP